MAAAASAAPSARAAGAEVDSALAALPAEFGLSTVQARLLAALMESPDCLLVAGQYDTVLKRSRDCCRLFLLLF